MITSAIPVIAVSDSARAEEYYCKVLGFQKNVRLPARGDHSETGSVKEIVM
jgi:uncharacterized glyoxalase superfamily protein PhnB